MQFQSTINQINSQIKQNLKLSLLNIMHMRVNSRLNISLIFVHQQRSNDCFAIFSGIRLSSSALFYTKFYALVPVKLSPKTNNKPKQI